MPDFVKLAATAARLVSSSGRSVTLERFNQTSADSAKPWSGPTDPRATVDATVTTKAAFVEPASVARFGIVTVDEDLLKRSDQVMLVAPGSTITADLATFNEVVDGSVRWKIEIVRTLKPADTVMLYMIGVKR